MTWGEFKKKAEEEGVKDDDVLFYIDLSYSLATQHIKVERETDNTIIIRD